MSTSLGYLHNSSITALPRIVVQTTACTPGPVRAPYLDEQSCRRLNYASAMLAFLSCVYNVIYLLEVS